MTNIKFLKVQFTDTIQPWEIPAFRGAIIAKVGRAHHWFHNHIDDGKFLYRYPKIQYKCLNHRATLLCIHEGVDEIHKLFEKLDWSININERNLEMRIHRLDMHEFNLQTLEHKQRYHIRQWVALNQKNYPIYQKMTALSDKIALLEQKLASNIISFAKSINWRIDERIQINLVDLPEPSWVKLKGKKVMGFDVTFDANVFLPNFLGLGGKVSLGYGVVKRVREKKAHQLLLSNH